MFSPLSSISDGYGQESKIGVTCQAVPGAESGANPIRISWTTHHVTPTSNEGGERRS